MFALIAFKMMIVAIIVSIIQGAIRPKAFLWLIPINGIMFGINYLIAYQLGVYQQLSTFAGCNTFEVIIVGIISLFCLIHWSNLDDANSELSFMCTIIGIICGFLLTSGINLDISIHTNYAMKPSAHSIVATKMNSEKIPTLNKSDTPEPLAPKTVFHEIDQNWTQVPHPNAYSIATNENDKREIQAQYYHHKPVYIVPLMFSNKTRSAHSNYHYYRTIPGYWMISATNPNASPHFVHKTISYSDSSYFNHNTDRLLYQSHPEAVEISCNAQLEINEHGTPYYVETLRKSNNHNNRPNFHQLETSVVNAQNGKIHFYHHLNEAPKFIDESVTSDVANDIAQDYGENRGGYFNINGFLFWGGHQKNVMQPTKVGPEDHMTTVFNKGHISYVTDMTIPGTSKSAVGVLSVDGRTGHVKLYKSNGMNDGEDAKDQANTNYRKGLHAHMPVLYDIKGHPTWVSVILNHNGQIMDFYYQDAHDSNIHASGSTPNTALNNYKYELVTNLGSNHSSTKSKSSKIKGVVDRVIASPNKVVFTLKNDKKYYIDYSVKSVLMNKGDKVKFKTGSNGIGHNAKDLIDNALD